MKTSHLSTIFFCAILIFSIYSIPNQIGDAYAHRSSGHRTCWWLGWEGPPLVITVLTIAFQLLAVVLAFWTAGSSLSWIQPADIVGFISKIIAVPIQFAIVAACGPQIISPPSAVAGESHLDCTSSEGFEFDQIVSTDERVLEKITDDFQVVTSHQINKDGNFFKKLPDTLMINSFWHALLGNIIILMLGFLLDVILLVLPTPGEKALVDSLAKDKVLKKEVFKAFIKYFPSFLASTTFGAGFFPLIDELFMTADMEIKDEILKRNSTSAISFHPLVIIRDNVTSTSATKFDLGQNTLTYKTEKAVPFIKNDDTDKFPLNVYDNEPPKINFGNDKHITLEANTHYGFKVDSKSLPLLQNGIIISDNCDQNPQLEYIGSNFFLVSSIKQDQYAQWVAKDLAPDNYWALTELDVARSLDSDIERLGSSPDNFMETRTAQITPFDQIEFTQPKEGFSTLRHLLVKVANSEINELIDEQKERSKLPPTGDITIGGDLIDFVTEDKISIVGVEQESKLADIPIDRRLVTSDSLSEDTVIELLNISHENFEAGKKAIKNSGSTLLVGLDRRNTLGDESAESNVFVDFQFVKIDDTISPNILVTEDLSVIVNSTHPSETESGIVDEERGGCTKVDQDYTCALKIRPPAVFDIADPFPIIYENFTEIGEFNPIEGDLIGNFPLGVSIIGWKAVDFTGNGNQTGDIVTQFVNLKLNGTNQISRVFDVNATVFSTVPQQITLIANNTDQDPLKFLIESNPSKGILDTPLDAVFLTKFQKFGSVSKLKGITNEGSDEIFFTDSRNERVLKINSIDETLGESFVGPQLGTPIAISKSGFGWNEFTISDWSQNKIIQTTDDGTVLQTFKVQELFEKPEYLTVDQNTDEIYVTDSLNGTISILKDFNIFSSPKGIEINNTSDTVYVVEETDSEVKVFDSLGVFVEKFGSDNLDSPTDITIDSQGNIYVLDTANNSIKNFTSEHSFAVSFSSTTSTLTFFDGPEGITASGGDIFIADTQNHQVKKISEFTPQIQEFYDNATVWTDFASDISIKAGKDVAEFKNVASGPGNSLEHIYQELNQTLNNTWSAEFKIRSGNLNNDANAFIWLLTNDTAHPQNVTSQNALGVVYDKQELKIYQRYGDVNNTSAGIPLPQNNQNYFVSLDKLGNTQAAMVVFSDQDRTTQIANGNVTHVISNNISDLHVLQHANDILNGNETLTLDIDNTFINPLITWLGKCDSGPNCNAGVSVQFTCTDTTCFGSGTGSLDGQFDLPKGISANSTHLFVADYNNNRMQIFNSGTHISNLNVTSPTDVEYSSSSASTAISSENQTVVIFKNNGDTISFGEFGSELGDFSSIGGLGTDSSGKIYVSDNTLMNIQIFDEDGTFEEEWQSSITARFGDFIERIQLYFPGMQVGALDTHNETVVIGDWTPDNERVIVANSKGGNLTQHDISQISVNPHSLAFRETEIFISDPSTQKLIVVDKDTGVHSKDISALNTVNDIIIPTGITINDIQNSGEKIYVFDNATEKIFSMEYPNLGCVDPEPGLDEDGDGVFTPTDPDDNNACNPDPQNEFCIVEPGLDEDGDGVLSQDDPDDNNACTPDPGHELCVLPEPVDEDGDGVFTPTDEDDNNACIPHLPADFVFNAKDLFVNLNDIAVNDTHVFGLDLSQNKSSIIQIRWDKGIQDEVQINENITGVTLGVNGDSDLLFFTTKGTNNELIAYNRTSDNTTGMFDLESLGISPSGITTIPMISTLVDKPIENIVDPRGLVFSPDKQKLYVSDFGESEIKIFNTTTFDLIEAISDVSLSLPTDLIFGPNGNLFVASFGNDAILEINVTDNNSFNKFAHGGEKISYPVGLAISNNSKELYVSSSENNEITRHGLFDVTETINVNYTDPDTNEIVFVSHDVSVQEKGQFLGNLVNAENAETLANVQDITIGPDNRMYAASFDSDQILRWDIDGTFRGVFGDANRTSSGLHGPSGIIFSPDGSLLFVSSSKNNHVLGYRGDTGKFIGIFSDETAKVPDGLVLKPDGNLLVSSRSTGEILEYGQLKSKFYLSDWSDIDNPRILGLSANGTITLSQNLNHLNLVNPQNIVADNLAKLWIADAGPPSRLVQINPVSNVELTNLDVSNLVEVSAPTVTLVPNSEPPVYVDDFGKNFTSIPKDVVTTITPKGLSIDKNDKLYVTDWNNHRIIQLDQNGTFSGQIRVNSTFTEPADIAVNQTDTGKLNDIWVFDANFNENNNPRLISLDAEKQFKKIDFADELSPLLRGLDSSGGNMITTPSNSGSLFVINSTLDAYFDSKHFVIPLGIDLGENSVYVSDWKEKRIVELDKSANFEREFDFKLVGFPTSELGDLEVSESKELFWITEPRRAVIDQINFTGTITKYLSIGDKYVLMASVDSDLEDNFFVASTADTSIKKFDIRGNLLGNVELDLGGGSMKDIALGPDGSESVFLAVSNTINSIKKFNSTNLTNQGEIALNFMPSSIAVDNDGNIYVSNSTLEVTKYKENFDFDSSFDIDFSVDGQIADMVIDSENNLYAADKTNHRVYKYDLASDELVGWLGKCDTTSSEENCITESLHSKGFTCDDNSCKNDVQDSVNNGLPYGRDNGQFFVPTSLAIDGLDNIYVSDVKLSRTQIEQNMQDENIFDDTANVPRVQKFTKEGFFVEQVISDRDNALIQGNFEWVKAIAYGKNNFYVADIDKLHVFDVNPFRNIKFDPLTQNTTAQITYESLVDIVNDTDSFLYSVFDGFDKSQNNGNVTITIENPDPDGDGIFGDVDLSDEFSDEFESPIDGTTGNIQDRGNQKLLVREARDAVKGLYIQADIRETGDKASVNLCDNIANIELTPGDRVIATCILGKNNKSGVELEVLRGEVSGIFYDGKGRNSTYIIPVDNTIFFGQDPFEFISGEKNFDTITQTVGFNNKKHNYLVPPESTVRVDTAPPILPDDKCTIPLELEAESVLGVMWNGNLTDPESNLAFTGQFEKIKGFLDFKSSEVDNGNPQETDGEETDVLHNATNLFQYGNSSIPYETKVEFFTVDKIGNNATCVNSIFVKDSTGPILDFGSEFRVDSDGLRIENVSERFSETGRVFWDLPKILDLPDVYDGTRLEVENRTSDCTYTSGSSFKISPIINENATDTVRLDTVVRCFGKDLADNLNEEVFGFNVRITPHPDGLQINQVIAGDKPGSKPSGPGLTVGDIIWVEFTMPTNQPPVANKTHLDAIFDLQDGDFGNNPTGKWVNPSNLLITINDVASPPLDLIEDITGFDLKNNPSLTSSGGLLNSSGTIGYDNIIILDGSFSKPTPPFISAFIANDPLVDLDDPKNDKDYSKDDTFTIRFSEPVKAPFGIKLDKDKINSLFSFSQDLGEDYSGVWQNLSTLVITVDEVLDDEPSQLPTLGTTTATVIGDITNRARTSENSKSVSPPLSGTFGDYYTIMDINKNSLITQTLPSGITLGINFPNGTTIGIVEADIIARQNIVISETLDISISNSTGGCEMGCNVTFWIHQSELDQFGVSVNNLRILHDENDDGVFDNEALVPEIEEIAFNLFSVTVKVFSFTSIALGATIDTGGGGDGTAPHIESLTITEESGGFGAVTSTDIGFNNYFPLIEAKTGNRFIITLTIYENSGPQAFEHISLYMNLLGFDSQVHQSDTYIRWDKNNHWSVKDPNGYLSNTDVKVSTIGNKIEVVFSFEFVKPMKTSDVIIRTWDTARNSWDANFPDLLEITGNILLDEQLGLDDIDGQGSLFGSGNGTSTESRFPEGFIEKWAGFSSETISDVELLTQLGLEGDYIPEWFKITTAKWFMEDKISEQEFVDALEFLSKSVFLFAS